MKIRFLQMVAAPDWQIPTGAVLTIDKLTKEQERWLRDGVLEIVRDESEIAEAAADHQETPERPFVPRLFPDSLIVCLGGGPSLTQEDVDFCRGRATATIAINDAYRLAPWADVLYAADASWWRLHWHQVKGLPARKYSITSVDIQLPDSDSITRRSKMVTHLLNTGQRGVEFKRTGLRTGKNSGYQAINLAMHLGATTVVLLGYDMQRKSGCKSHWFGEHPRPLNTDSRYGEFIECFETMRPDLKKAGVEVINCTRTTALKTFPWDALEAVLPQPEIITAHDARSRDVLV